MYRSALKQLRGGRIGFGDLFSGSDCFLRLLGATLVAGALGTIGLLLCVIPGLLVGGLFLFTAPLIVDRNLGVIEAMRMSRELTRRNLLLFTLFALVVAIIAWVGSYVCYVGLLVSYPLLFTIMTVAYRDCFGVAGARRFVAPVPPGPPSYASAPPQAWPPPPAVCLNCQMEVPAQAAFCPRCGSRLRP
jgi:uncharacterized membrane protein